MPERERHLQSSPRVLDPIGAPPGQPQHARGDESLYQRVGDKAIESSQPLHLSLAETQIGNLPVLGLNKLEPAGHAGVM